MSIREFVHRLMGKEKELALSGLGVQEASKQSIEVMQELPPPQLVFPWRRPVMIKPKKWVFHTELNRVGTLFQFTDSGAAELHIAKVDGTVDFAHTEEDLSKIRLARLAEIPKVRWITAYRDDGTVDENASINQMNELGYH
jgi:hypothetical protein